MERERERWRERGRDTERHTHRDREREREREREMNNYFSNLPGHIIGVSVYKVHLYLCLLLNFFCNITPHTDRSV